MAKKKAVKTEEPTDQGEWKEPWNATWRGGWKDVNGKVDPELRGLAIRFSAVFRAKPTPIETAKVMQAVLPALRNLIGDHAVVAALGEPKPAAWTSGLSFRKRMYGQDVKLPVSELVNPSTWVRMEELFEDGIYALRAFRGGGSSRHQVFAMTDGHVPDGESGIPYSQFTFSLLVSCQYVTLTGRDSWRVDGVPRDRPVGPEMRDRCWHGLMEQFFEASSRLHGFVRGEGGIVRPDDVRYTISERVRRHTSDELVIGVVRELAQPSELHVAVPSVATFLGPEQCERLGGAEAFIRKANLDWRLASHAGWVTLRVVQLGRGVLVQLTDMLSWRPSENGGISPRIYKWFMRVLLESGLLGQLDPRSSAQIAAEFVEGVDRWREQFDKTFPSVGSDEARVHSGHGDRAFTPPTARPACVCSARSVIEDCPDDEFVRENVVCWRVRPREGPVDAGLTVYARHSAELGQLIAPVLVGSLDAERAALAFHPRVHGYDAMCEAAESPEGKRREASYGRLKQAVCKACQSRVFHVWAALEYPDDLEEGDLGAGAKVEEWFSWFWLVTKCASCGEVQTVVDHECA